MTNNTCRILKRLFAPRILVALVVGLFAVNALGQTERITNYHSDIAVNADASIVVTETIAVVAANVKIKHGIYRDIPTRMAWHGMSFDLDMSIDQITRDGKAEPYHTERKGSDLRIYCGAENVTVDPGEHTYTITYRMGPQVRSIADHDELYWNVTGTKWDFSIDHASATVTLPDGVDPAQITAEAYTGYEGDKGADYTAKVGTDATVTYEMTRALSRHEGITIMATWPKGHVTTPSDGDMWRRVQQAHMPEVVLLGGLVVVFVYYLLTWAAVGRDPSSAMVMPRIDPPAELSPAEARYIRRMGFDQGCVSAAILNLAVKGALQIKVLSDGDYQLCREEEPIEPLDDIERAFMEKLFRNGSSLTLKQSNRLSIKGAVDALRAALRKRHKGSAFVTNRRFVVGGIVLSAAAWLTAAFAGRQDQIAIVLFMTVWLSGWTAGTVALWLAVLAQWRKVFSQPGRRIAGAAGAIGISLFALPFTAGECFGIFMLAMAVSVPFVAIVLLLLLLNWRSSHLLKRPTETGRRMLNDIDGFRMYLAGRADQQRYTGGDDSLAMFEQHLPYAVALDVSKEWSTQFSDAMRDATQPDGPPRYMPYWLHDPAGRYTYNDPSAFCSSLGSALGSSITSASSSGSSGGGSSGGGGGGGGGGGW